jgi:hypothetical protein
VGTITGETGGSPMQVAAATWENGDNRGRSNATGIHNTSKYYGMQSYHARKGYIEFRFMTSNSKGFYVARDLKRFLAAAREQDDEFTILPLAGIGNNLCIVADIPNSKTNIEKYFRHDVDCGVHFRYLTLLPISVVGRVAKSTPTAFWGSHLSAFKPNGIPAEIDTQELQYSTKKRA